MAELNALVGPHGFGPTPIIWYPFARRLWNGENLFDPTYAQEWRERLDMNRRAADCVQAALPLVESDRVRADLQWLLTCLAVSIGILDLCARYSGRRSVSKGRDFLRDHQRLERFVPRYGPFTLTDPLGGDVATWGPVVRMLKYVCPRKSTPVQ